MLPYELSLLRGWWSILMFFALAMSEIARSDAVPSHFDLAVRFDDGAKFSAVVSGYSLTYTP